MVSFPTKAKNSGAEVSAHSDKPLTEKEVKLITPDGSSEPFRLFTAALERGEVPGIRQEFRSRNQRLITRQLDTPDQVLREAGISLRIRGNYKGGQVWTPDVNIKTGKVCSDIHMTRGEYEARIADPGYLDLRAIEDKYRPYIQSGVCPDLEEACRLIREVQGDLTEHFLIDTTRMRRVVQIDPGFGLSDKKAFYGELINDKVSYSLRMPDMRECFSMAVNAGKHEMEIEPIHIPCEYNPYSGAENHICCELDALDEDIALMFLQDAIEPYGKKSGHEVVAATLSKSERGFAALAQIEKFFADRRAGAHALANDFSRSAKGFPLSNDGPRVFVSAGQSINVPWDLRFAA